MLNLWTLLSLYLKFWSQRFSRQQGPPFDHRNAVPASLNTVITKLLRVDVPVDRYPHVSYTLICLILTSYSNKIFRYNDEGFIELSLFRDVVQLCRQTFRP